MTQIGKRRALALFSGGLDSMIAIKLMVDQGIDVIALHIKIGFGGTKDVTEVMKQRAEMAGAEFKIVDVREEYIQNILFDPVHGYGKNFNPCIDCHGYMFKIAKAMMSELGASFIFTGEVIGQRPMSQRHDAMKQVAKLADDKEEKLIVRPMSAKLMEKTTPWIDREKLLDISGRSRERQLAMAEAYGWEDYESPGGGCLLTESHYSDRIKEFISFDDGAKLAVGRDKEDNEGLQAIQSDKYVTIKLPIGGPFSLLSANASSEDRALAAKLAMTYARSSAEESYDVEVGEETITVSPFAEKKEAQQYFFNAKS
jgi:tRNA-specific 2-thiouridylase